MKSSHYAGLVCFFTAVLSSRSPLAAAPQVEWFRMRTPGDGHDIQQASDLCWGRIGRWEGLWTCCDRNGQHSAGRIYFFSAATLVAARPGGSIVADAEWMITPPAGSWDDFARAHETAGRPMLDDLRARMVPATQRGQEPYLDLEAITIAPGLRAPGRSHLFVVAEEPFSAILELALADEESRGEARLVAVYAYSEDPAEQGAVRNDGLEALAYDGSPGRFYFAEEGTRDTQGRPGAPLFFLDPRLGRCELGSPQVRLDAGVCDGLTAAVRAQRQGSSQTLNALCTLGDGRLLVVDRNGGWILRVDVGAQTAQRWLNLYDLGGQSLRTLLAKVPHERNLPYVSIEGIAVDDAGALWLVDDPAIPEGFRESTLLRVRLPGELRVRRAASAPSR